MKNAHLNSRLASLGLAMVFLVLTAFSIWAAVITQQAANDTRVSVHLNDLYEQVRYAITEEESLEYEYAFKPRPGVLVKYRATGALSVKSLQIVQQDGNARDRALVKKLLAEHERYLFATNKLFMAVDAHDMARAQAINDTILNPLFSLIDQQVYTAANEHHEQAIRSLAALDQTQHMTFTATLIVFGIGLFLFGVFWVMLRIYQRKIDEAMQAELARLARVASTDNLTILGNYRAYQEDFHRALERAWRNGEMIGLALIDIDELKGINDEHGHMYGDHVLTALASLLRDVHGSDNAYRLEGDEFALILSRMTLAQAVTGMERLRQDAQQCLFGATVSIGIAVSVADETDADTLQGQADAALYEAKRRSRNVVVTFEDIRESVSLTSPTKAHALRRLLAERNLTVVFQPIWDLDRDAILSFEALTRPAAEYGFTGPQEAFDIAEKIGRTHELDYICLQAILARAAELPPDARLFVNLSPQTLDHDLLTGSVLLEAVVAAGLTTDRVVLELTERSMARLPVVIREARQLRSLGFCLALDDTGAGNAGLEMLSQLPVDFVKIDRAVVVNALSDKTAYSVLAGIMTIAREAGTYVIAEGIENAQMLDLVRQVGVQGVQGYLLGRPSETIPDAKTLQGFSPFAHKY